MSLERRIEAREAHRTLLRRRVTRRSALSGDAMDASKRFHAFFRLFAWPVLQPGTPFQDNWHIGAICEHLEAVTAGQIKRLIINMPFRMLKSSTVSQAWPAWEWVQKPSAQYLTASYARDVATRDAVYSRRIIESEAYQACFGERFRMTSDQNVKTRYENDHAGSRVVTSTDGGATGFGGNRIIWDDPISALEADSETARLRAIEFYRGTIATRLNNPADDAIVVVHQRLNSNDPTGYLLRESGAHWEQLILPMRYEREFTKTTSLGFIDPRTDEGELMQPTRVDEDAVKALEATLGPYHTDAQLQQRPASRGGIIFKRDHWKFYRALPDIDDLVLSLDATFKDVAGADFVALHVWGRKGADKYLIDRVHERMGFAATVQAGRTMHAKHKDKCVAVLIEDKANGSAIIETLSKEISGVLAINPEGGKVARAYAMEPEHAAGNLHLPDPADAPWVEEVIAECASFPGGAHDDDVDAMTQAVNWFKNRESTTGLLDYYREQYEQEMQRRGVPREQWIS